LTVRHGALRLLAEVPGSLPQTILLIYRTFSARTRPQTTSEITEAATIAKMVRFFSFNSLIPETTTKKNPPRQNTDWLLMRMFPDMCKPFAHFVTDQYRRPG